MNSGALAGHSLTIVRAFWPLASSPLGGAANAIIAAHKDRVAKAPLSEAVPTKLQTQLSDNSLQDQWRRLEQRRSDAARVPRFARALAELPMRNGGALEVTTHQIPQPAIGHWQLHKKDVELQAEPGALPELWRSSDAIYPPHLVTPSYTAQASERSRGKVTAEWQYSEAGGVTMPHIDLDGRSRRDARPIHTYLAVTQGVEVIIAWNQSELDEGLVQEDMLGTTPTLVRLLSLRSLTVVRARPGDLVYIPARTAHIVVTESAKVHMAWHMYP